MELRFGVLGREVFKLDSQRDTLAPKSAEWYVCSLRTYPSLGDANPVSKCRAGLGTSLAPSFCGPYHASQLRRLGRMIGSAVADITDAAIEMVRIKQRMALT